MKKWMLTTVAVAVAVLVVLCYWIFFTNRLIVVNNSGKEITRLTIKVARQEHPLAHIKAGRVASCTFRLRGDTSFEVHGTLSDGTVIAGDFGYATNGMFGVRATFTVQPNGSVNFKQE